MAVIKQKFKKEITVSNIKEVADKLFLASGSPRRLALLNQLGLSANVVDAPIEEVALPNESPRSFVTRMAIEKAFAGYNKLAGHDIWVVAGDTLVELEGVVLGKPRNQHQASEFLTKLSGKTHRVLSAVAVIHQGETFVGLNDTAVTFASLTDQQLASYLASNEWQGKAGAYAIQGVGAQFISHINGSYSGVMGLPLFETSELLVRAGYPIFISSSIK